MIKDRVINAYVFAKKAHEGQVRKFSGLTYFTHPKGVARKAEDLTKDENIVIAAFLHDVCEDCGVTNEEIKELFGEDVASLVYEMTSTKEGLAQFPNKAEYLLNKMTLMSDRALTLKLIDRQDNVHYMDKDCKTTKHKQFVKRYALETRYIIDNIKKNRKLDETQTLLVDMIDVRLRYIDKKYLW